MFRGKVGGLLPSYRHDISKESFSIALITHFINSMFSIFGLIVFGWYSTAIVAVLSSKVIMMHFPFPFFLCFTQFLFAFLITTVLNYLHQTKPLSPQYWHHVLHIGVSYTFGFIFTNISFSLVNTSFAETIKSSEPVSSVILGYYIVNEVASLWTYFSLFPICVGVALACVTDYSFHFYGFLFALLSNFCFSYRAVIAKQLYHLSPTLSAASSSPSKLSIDIDELQLFRSISAIGLAIITPLVIFLEYRGIYDKITSSDSFTLSTAIFIGWCCLLNGIGYTMYNVLSFYALRRSDVITHAVLNVFRRVVIITSSIFFFQVVVTPMNLCGIVLAILGVAAFTCTRIKRK